MTVRAEIRMGIGVFLALLLVVAFAGIGLLERMSPAIERILQENVCSLESTEVMLAVLAEHPGAVPPEGRKRYLAAIRRARGNVTHREERPYVVSLTKLSGRALAGDLEARRRSVQSILGLARVNRVEMQRADRRAQQVGTAGAWAMVVLGIAGVLLAVLVFRRLLARLLTPLVEIDQTLRAAVEGDPHRRAHIQQAPSDLVRIAEDLNNVLDECRETRT